MCVCVYIYKFCPFWVSPLPYLWLGMESKVERLLLFTSVEAFTGVILSSLPSTKMIVISSCVFLVFGIYPRWYLLKHFLPVGLHLHDPCWLKHYFMLSVSQIQLYVSYSGLQGMTVVWCFSRCPVVDQVCHQPYFPVTYVATSTIVRLWHCKSVIFFGWQPFKTFLPNSPSKALVQGTFLLILPFLGASFGEQDTGPFLLKPSPNIKDNLN